MQVRNTGRREALIEQVAYLIDEVTALEGLLNRVPDSVLSEKPMGKWSIKEVLGHLADCDRDIFLPRLKTICKEPHPEFENIDQDRLVEESAWNDRSLEEILRALKEERYAVVDYLRSVPEEQWIRSGVFPNGKDRTIFDVAYYISQHDAHHLRSIAMLLHESHLTDRPTDLPK